MKTQTEIKSLKEGKYVIIDGEPCQIIKTQRSAPGKHGHLKIRLQGISIFTGQKKEIVKPGHEKMDVPIIDKRVGQVVSIQGERAHIMDMKDYNTFEATVPENLKKKIKEGEEVVYWEVLGRKLLKEMK